MRLAMPPKRHRLAALLHALLGLGALGGAAALVLTLGYPSDSAPHAVGAALALAVAILFAAEHLLHVVTEGSWRAALRHHWLGNILLGLLMFLWAALGLWTLLRRLLGEPAPALGGALLASLQIFVLASIARALLKLNLGLARLRLRPAVVSFLLFALAILAGGALLTLPRMMAAGRGVPFLDALFTSCSSVCVTGLTVIDIGSSFSRLGQGLILVLIQAGGLGVMVLAAFLAMMAGQGMSIRERHLVGEVLSMPARRQMGWLIRFIILVTLGCELAGALVLSFALRSGPAEGPRVFDGVFHAVSAFCNAGLSPYALSLIEYARRPAVVLTTTLLLVLGGLGFMVLSELWRGGRLVARRRARRGRREPLSPHARLALTMTAVLLVAGWALILAGEWNRSLAGLPLGHRLTCALFMSATPRTAGFTVTDPALWAPATSFLLMLFMVVGGSSGGTAGGLKTTTLGVMLAAARGLVLGRERTVVFRREVPWRHIHEAVVVITVYLAILCLGILALLLTEGQGFRETLFEAASALGTVGLSLGITPELTTAGKWVCMVLMLAGRVGPLTLALALAAPVPRSPVRYPEGRFLIG